MPIGLPLHGPLTALLPARRRNHSAGHAVNQAESVGGSVPRQAGPDTSATRPDSDSRRGREASPLHCIAMVASPTLGPP